MVNFWAVLVSAIASIVIGSIWYGPLFGKRFIKEMGMDKLTKKEQDNMKKSMMSSYILQTLASLVTFYVLAWFVEALDMLTIGEAVTIAFIVWIGFYVPFKLGETVWGGKWPLFWIGIGNMLVTLLAAGAIIGAWA